VLHDGNRRSCSFLQNKEREVCTHTVEEEQILYVWGYQLREKGEEAHRKIENKKTRHKGKKEQV
jgi:hypothetical protein